jgi:hypothetical protein
MPARAERMVVRLGTLHGYPFSPPAADWMLSWHSSGDAPMDTPVAVVAAAEVCVCACVVVAVVVVGWWWLWRWLWCLRLCQQCRGAAARALSGEVAHRGGRSAPAQARGGGPRHGRGRGRGGAGTGRSAVLWHTDRAAAAAAGGGGWRGGGRGRRRCRHGGGGRSAADRAQCEHNPRTPPLPARLLPR